MNSIVLSSLSYTTFDPGTMPGKKISAISRRQNLWPMLDRVMGIWNSRACNQELGYRSADVAIWTSKALIVFPIRNMEIVHCYV